MWTVECDQKTHMGIFAKGTRVVNSDYANLFQTKQLVHKSSGSCLQIDDQQVMLKSCNSAAPVEQRWELENYQPHL